MGRGAPASKESTRTPGFGLDSLIEIFACASWRRATPLPTALDLAAGIARPRDLDLGFPDGVGVPDARRLLREPVHGEVLAEAAGADL
jgi:hypothetical protein